MSKSENRDGRMCGKSGQKGRFSGGTQSSADEAQAGEEDFAAGGITKVVDKESLGVGGVGVDDEGAPTGGVTAEEGDGFFAGFTVHGADEDIGAGFDEPAFEEASDGGRGVMRHDYGHRG